VTRIKVNKTGIIMYEEEQKELKTYKDRVEKLRGYL